SHVLVFNDPSRVVRESASYLHYKELSRKHGTGIVCVSDDDSLKGLDAPHRKVMTFMQGYASEMDNANRTRVFREKKAERFRRGQLAAGRLPLGYRYDKQRSEEHTSELQALTHL